MTLREKQTKFWFMVAQLILKSVTLKTPFFIFEWTRSLEQQKINVARGVSKTMNSKHLDGLAIDIVFLADVQDDGKVNYSSEKFKVLGEYWEGLDPLNVWGGRFNESQPGKGDGWDSGHFQTNIT
jgi:hypothetical protein